MKKLFHLSLASVLSLSLLGCEDSKSSGPQPTAGNEPPKYSGTKGGPLAKKGAPGPATKKEVETRTAVQP